MWIGYSVMLYGSVVVLLLILDKTLGRLLLRFEAMKAFADFCWKRSREKKDGE